MKHLLAFLLFTILLINTNTAFCQTAAEKYPFQEKEKYSIETYGDFVYHGKFHHKDSTSVTIVEYEISRVSIPYHQIFKITHLDSLKIRRKAKWGFNPDASRYFFAPTAITLKKGDFYYQNTYLLINSIYAGISDHITIGAGLELQFLMMNQEGTAPSFFVTTNIGYRVSEKFHIGGGALLVNTIMPNSTKRSNGGYMYGLGTYGTSNHNLTFGLGWGALQNEFRSKPFVTFSAMTRIGKRAAFIAENWFLPYDDYTGLYSAGMRFFGKRVSVDIALVYIDDDKEKLISVIPFLDFVYRF